MKIGRIKISDSFFIEHRSFDLLPIFSKFIPIFIEIKPMDRYYIYLGICDEFEDITEEQEYPFYDATVKTNEDKSIEVNFKKL
jgi:hypothetical protein